MHTPIQVGGKYYQSRAPYATVAVVPVLARERCGASAIPGDFSATQRSDKATAQLRMMRDCTHARTSLAAETSFTPPANGGRAAQLDVPPLTCGNRLTVRMAAGGHAVRIRVLYTYYVLWGRHVLRSAPRTRCSTRSMPPVICPYTCERVCGA